MQAQFLATPSEPFTFSSRVLTDLGTDAEIVKDLKELVAILQGKLETLPLPKNLDGAGRVVAEYSPEELRPLKEELCVCVARKVNSTISNLTIKRKDTEEEHSVIKRQRQDACAQTRPLFKQARLNSDLVDAVINEDMVRVEALLAEGATMSERDRGLALRRAAVNGHLGIVQALLTNGAVISAEHRGFAVGFAAENGHLGIVQALLANGAVISAEHRGFAVGFAAENRHLGIVQALLANGPISAAFRDLAIIDAADHGHLEIMQALLANGNISEGARGWVVRDAVRNGHHAIAEILKPKSWLDRACVIS
jgi:hypothetical protein